MSKNSFEIPEDWAWTTMGDIADVVGGGTPKTNDLTNYEDGVIPWITPADLSGYASKYIGRGARSITQKGLKSSSARMIPAGSVLFTSRAPVGYVALASNDVCTNQGFKSFVLKSKNISPDYVYWWLKGNKDLAESYASGTTFLELSGAKAKQLPIPIAPLEQQTRIVAEIEKQFSRLDEAIDNLKRVKANLKRYKAAVLKAAVEGKLTEEWRKAHPDVEPASELLKRILLERRAKSNGKGRYKEPATPDTSDLPSLPEGWTWTLTQQLGEVQLGRQRSPKNRSKNYPTKYIRAANITEDGLDLSDLLDMEFTPAERARYQLRRDDIVLSEASGSSRQVGKPAVWQDVLPECCFQNTVIRLRPIGLSADYLLTAFKHFYVNGIFARVAGGVGINHLGADKFSMIPVPLPPLIEQQNIVAEVERRFSVIEKSEATTVTNLTRADQLHQSILTQAFSGELFRDTPAKPHEAAIG